MDSTRFFMPQWEGFQQEMGFAQAVRSKGDLLHISGTAALDGDAKVVFPDDLAAQMDYVYSRIGDTLSAFSLGFANLVRQTVYTTDMTTLLEAVFNKIPNKYFGKSGPIPATTAIMVAGLTHSQLVIEIQATAAFPG